MNCHTSVVSCALSFVDGLIFTKVNAYDGFVLYAAQISTGLGGVKKRYIIAACPEKSLYPQPKEAHLKNLEWKSIQTRELAGSYNLKQQVLKRLPDTTENPSLGCVARDTAKSTYTVQNSAGVTVELLNDPKKKTNIQHKSQVSLLGSLETWGCVVVLDRSYIPQTSPTLPSEENWFHYNTPHGFTIPGYEKII